MDAKDRAWTALQGVSVGDAFGERFFLHPSITLAMLEQRAIPALQVWKYTDDTEMALSVFEVVERNGAIDQDELARAFSRRYLADRMRGYGGGAHRLLEQIARGEDWREASRALFRGGSFGNGGAMRVAPLGAYLADRDWSVIVEEARKSAEVTHAHHEGQAGAIAIAVATAAAWRIGQGEPLSLIDTVIEHTPPGLTRDNVQAARELAPGTDSMRAAELVGSGGNVSSQDTVGYSVWCAAKHLEDFEAAMWFTVAGLGDRDTTCAIVGGIVATRVGIEGIPEEWLRRREPLKF